MVQYITITREALSKSQGMVRLTTQDWLEPNPRKNREETSYRNKDLEHKNKENTSIFANYFMYLTCRQAISLQTSPQSNSIGFFLFFSFVPVSEWKC